MKIDEKQFKKLKQLDRIEFRQKLILINDVGNDSYRSIMAAIICAILATVSFVFSSFFFLLFYFLSFLLFVCGIIQLILSVILKQNLEKEYFKIEVKK